ncbi:NlpC/P60 family protein [Bacillus sp. SL00103]
MIYVLGILSFLATHTNPGISHVGMYIGGDRFIHASRSESVTISYLSESYWREKWTGAKRLTELKLAKENPIVSKAATYIGEVPYVKVGRIQSKALTQQGSHSTYIEKYLVLSCLAMHQVKSRQVPL